MHLTDEQLNEYLDNECKDRQQIETHISFCVDCAARLTGLQVLFSEIESLPDVTLPHDLAVPVTRRVSGYASLPRFLRLTVILQCAAAIAAVVFAAPFATRSLLPYWVGLQMPSRVELLLAIQTRWTAWLAIFSQFHLSGIPKVPVFGFSGLFAILAIVGVSVLWLLGNGLLLRDQLNFPPKQGERYG